jgi:5-oxoprolinase (ATP-hydrolysing)
VPEGILNPAFPPDPDDCPAVVGGNVETSQLLVDTLLRALGLAVCSQGTNNIVLSGSDSFGFTRPSAAARSRARAGRGLMPSIRT